jgi:endonuclease-3 related protein
MAGEEPGLLREKLLGVKGLGKETVDCILCYACEMPVFVVDAYTKRICERYGLVGPDAKYDDIQALFTANLPQEVPLYNDFHAQIVHLGNAVCSPHPACDVCPIKNVASRCRYPALNNR